jgi:hypothetical protein
MLPSSAAGQDVIRVFAESDFVADSQPLFIGSISDPGVAADGSYVARIHVGSSFGDNYGLNPVRAESFLRGNTGPVALPTPLFQRLLREDAFRLEDGNPVNDPAGTTVGTRTYFYTEFRDADVDNAGNLAYFADVVFEDSATPGPDFTDFSERVSSVWLNDTPIAIEGEAVTDSSLPAGAMYDFVGLVGLGETGGLVYRAAYSDTGSAGSGLFDQAGTQIFGTGDAIGGTGTTAVSLGNSALSLGGDTYVTATTAADGQTYLVVNGDAATLRDGSTYITGGLIGSENGGLTPTETLPVGFNNPAAGPGGFWGFTGFTDDVADPDGDFDSVALINGYVSYRELDSVLDNSGGSVVIDGSAEQVAFNRDGDVLVIFDNALILNGTVIAEEGSDILNDSDDLRTFQSGAGLSDRDANGNVEVYFKGRNDAATGVRNNDTLYNITSAFDEGAILGDLDINGVVNLDDICAFAIAVLNDFEYTGVYGSAADPRGDFTADGLVNLDDVADFAALLGVDESVVLNKIPEPHSALLLAGLSALALRRRANPA